MKAAWALLMAAVAGVAAAGQSGLFEQPRPKSYVVYAAEQQTIPAGKPAALNLRFHVVDGYHVNSHTPKSDLLIPTRIELQPANGVKAGPAEYPAGQPYSFSFDPNETLDVYAGDFTVRLPLVATPGEHTIAGTLKYQACDNAACYPPKSVPIQILFTAR